MNENNYEELEKRCKKLERDIIRMDVALSDLKWYIFIIILAILTQPLFFK